MTEPQPLNTRQQRRQLKRQLKRQLTAKTIAYTELHVTRKKKQKNKKQNKNTAYQSTQENEQTECYLHFLHTASIASSEGCYKHFHFHGSMSNQLSWGCVSWIRIYLCTLISVAASEASSKRGAEMLPRLRILLVDQFHTTMIVFI